MTEEIQFQSEQEAVFAQFVLDQLRAGEDVPTIVGQLEQQGLSRARAAYLVDALQAAQAKAAEAERITPAVLLPAAVGGLVAATVGGVAWALIAVAAHAEIGFVAWGIGLLAGWAVVLFARGRRGRPLQALAVACAALGILIGKYGTFFYLLRDELIARYGAESASELGLLDPEVLAAFFGSMGEWVSAFDLVWVGLAMFTAWGLPRAAGLRKLRAAAAAPTDTDDSRPIGPG